MASTAAYAVMMPMVNAALRFLHARGRLSKAPGDQPVQLDGATRECVKEFQKKHGLDVDGVPGQHTQKALAQAMKEAAQEHPHPPEKAQSQEKPQAQQKAGKAAITTIYFTVNFGKSGSRTSVAVTATGCDGKSFDIGLYQRDKALVEKAGQLPVAGGKGSVEVTIPGGLADGTEIAARLSGEGLSAETKAKFNVDSTTSKITPEELEGFDTSDGQNGTPDWDKVAKRYGHAIIAAVYHRGERAGFRDYWNALASRPMVRGGYHFWVPEDDWEAQADDLHKVLEDIRPGVDLPPSLDLEFTEKVGKPMIGKLGTEETMRRFGKFWQAVVKRFGCYPIIYTSARVWEEDLRNPAVPVPEMTESPLWLARYVVRTKDGYVAIEPGTPDLPVPKPWGKRNWWFHQYRGNRWVKDASLDLLSEDVQKPVEARVKKAEEALEKAVKAQEHAADEHAKTQAAAKVEEAKAELKKAKAEMYKVAKLGDLDINRFQLLGDPATETSGERIRWVQRRLKGQKITASGEWGKETADALKAYQSAAGLEPTGLVDPRTFAKLAWEMP
jgi:peptidoglycan hydrolase-like protein with peptidoglycan-binding domain